MSVKKRIERPSGFRSVPVLTDPDVAHYPEFKDFLVKTSEVKITDWEPEERVY